MFQRLQSAAAVMRNALSALQWSLQQQLQAALTYPCFIPAPLLTHQLMIQHTAEKHNLQSWTLSFPASTSTHFYMHLKAVIYIYNHIIEYPKLLPVLSWHSLSQLIKPSKSWAQTRHVILVTAHLNHSNTRSLLQLTWKHKLFYFKCYEYDFLFLLFFLTNLTWKRGRIAESILCTTLTFTQAPALEQLDPVCL